MDQTQRNLESRIAEIGGRLLKAARSHQEGRFSAAFWSDKLMNWALSDTAFKVQLFRFIDVFPTLTDSDAVHQHLNEYLLQPGVKTPKGLKAGLAAGGFLRGTMARTVTGQVESMAKTFIAGRNAKEILKVLRDRWDQGIAFSVDLLGEACLSEAEAEVYRKRYMELLEELPTAVSSWPEQRVLEADHLGAIPRVNVSVKASSIAAKVDPVDFDGSVARIVEGVMPILLAAREKEAFVNFDMEHHHFKSLTIAAFKRCAEQIDTPMGIALQAYLRSGDEDADDLITWSKKTGRRITVRLVKGAYWDYEVISAQQRGWPAAVWKNKAETDACFERMAARFIEATPKREADGGVMLALGSHNVRSIASAIAQLEEHGLPNSAIELQMLYGMAEPLKRMAIDQKLRLREYVPVGEMIPGMAYLVRRLLENTSNESWLRHGFLDSLDETTLLASPFVDEQQNKDKPATGFYNEPLRDFADAKQREPFAEALRGAVVPKVRNDATTKDAQCAVIRAAEAFGAWRDTDSAERVAMLRRTAQSMRKHRDTLAGVIVKEAHKPWGSADADVCEAIDFCEYYAQQAEVMFEPQPLGDLLGESDELRCEPRGVGVVISPWNFPLAICCGMTAASLVTGNTTIVKPAEQTPGVAQLMCELFWDSGVPKDALQLICGDGETVGAALVRDPRVGLIAFTGSRSVGLDIVRAAGETRQGQPHIKKVIAEMGGKNAIIVDASADLDDAVVGVRNSAFGYAGQKCSACSRVIVVDSVHDHFVQRLVESSRSLVCGDAEAPATDVPPLIDAAAAAKMRTYVELARGEGREVLAAPGDGNLFGPHIYTGITPEHRTANEEVFGPLLVVMRASDFDDALRIANATDYKLTGGVYSRTPSHIQRVWREFRVGNLYINRAITGALVARQPFGGFGLSGTGPKAGGPSYLRQFVHERTITENTLRRGFSPDLTD